MGRITLKWLLLIGLLPALAGFAQTLKPVPHALKPSTKTTQPSDFYTAYCLSPKLLKKIKLFWVAPGDWKSYSQSLVQRITTFAGAQWIGFNVGKVICLYRGKPAGTFPISMNFGLIVPAPKGVNWKKGKGNYKNCVSNNIEDCPFLVHKKQPMGNIYKELRYIGGKGALKNE